jgi:hypothetical protein
VDSARWPGARVELFELDQPVLDQSSEFRVDLAVFGLPDETERRLHLTGDVVSALWLR